VDGCMDGCEEGWMDVRKHAWMDDEWMEGRRSDGWMNG